MNIISLGKHEMVKCGITVSTECKKRDARTHLAECARVCGRRSEDITESTHLGGLLETRRTLICQFRQVGTRLKPIHRVT